MIKTSITKLGSDDWNAILFKCNVCDQIIACSEIEKINLGKDKCPYCDRVITEIKNETHS